MKLAAGDHSRRRPGYADLRSREYRLIQNADGLRNSRYRTSGGVRCHPQDWNYRFNTGTLTILFSTLGATKQIPSCQFDSSTLLRLVMAFFVKPFGDFHPAFKTPRISLLGSGIWDPGTYRVALTAGLVRHICVKGPLRSHGCGVDGSSAQAARCGAGLPHVRLPGNARVVHYRRWGRGNILLSLRAFHLGHRIGDPNGGSPGVLCVTAHGHAQAQVIQGIRLLLTSRDGSRRLVQVTRPRRQPAS